MDDDIRLEPMIEGYQLIGDSQLCRLAEQYLNGHRKDNRVGLCVPGQTISQLYSGIINKTYPIISKIICLIGTNDLTKNTPIEEMILAMNALVQLLLEERHVKDLILLTVPPVPKLASSKDHWNKLSKFNSHLSALADGINVTVIKVHELFLTPSDPSLGCKDDPGCLPKPTVPLSPCEYKTKVDQTNLLYPKFCQPETSYYGYLENKRKSEGVGDFQRESQEIERLTGFWPRPQQYPDVSLSCADYHKNPCNSYASRLKTNFTNQADPGDFRHRVLQPMSMQTNVEDMWNVESIKPKTSWSESSLSGSYNQESKKTQNIPPGMPKVCEIPGANVPGQDINKQKTVEDVWDVESIKPKTSSQESAIVESCNQEFKETQNLPPNKPEIGEVRFGDNLSSQNIKRQNVEDIWNVESITPKTSLLESGVVDSDNLESKETPSLPSNKPKISERPFADNLLDENLNKTDGSHNKLNCPQKTSKLESTNKKLIRNKNKNASRDRSKVEHGNDEVKSSSSTSTNARNQSLDKLEKKQTLDSFDYLSSQSVRTEKPRFYDSYEKHQKRSKTMHSIPPRNQLSTVKGKDVEVCSDQRKSNTSPSDLKRTSRQEKSAKVIIPEEPVDKIHLREASEILSDQHKLDTPSSDYRKTLSEEKSAELISEEPFDKTYTREASEICSNQPEFDTILSDSRKTSSEAKSVELIISEEPFNKTHPRVASEVHSGLQKFNSNTLNFWKTSGQEKSSESIMQEQNVGNTLQVYPNSKSCQPRRSALHQILNHLNVVKLPCVKPDIGTPISLEEVVAIGGVDIIDSTCKSSAVTKDKEQSDSSTDSYCNDSKISKIDENLSASQQKYVAKVKVGKKNYNHKKVPSNENGLVTKAKTLRGVMVFPKVSICTDESVRKSAKSDATESQVLCGKMPIEISEPLSSNKVSQKTYEPTVCDPVVQIEPFSNNSNDKNVAGFHPVKSPEYFFEDQFNRKDCQMENSFSASTLPSYENEIRRRRYLYESNSIISVPFQEDQGNGRILPGADTVPSPVPCQETQISRWTHQGEKNAAASSSSVYDNQFRRKNHLNDINSVEGLRVPQTHMNRGIPHGQNSAPSPVRYYGNDTSRILCDENNPTPFRTNQINRTTDSGENNPASSPVSSYNKQFDKDSCPSEMFSARSSTPLDDTNRRDLTATLVRFLDNVDRGHATASSVPFNRQIATQECNSVSVRSFDPTKRTFPAEMSLYTDSTIYDSRLEGRVYPNNINSTTSFNANKRVFTNASSPERSLNTVCPDNQCLNFVDEQTFTRSRLESNTLGNKLTYPVERGAVGRSELLYVDKVRIYSGLDNRNERLEPLHLIDRVLGSEQNSARYEPSSNQIFSRDRNPSARFEPQLNCHVASQIDRIYAEHDFPRSLETWRKNHVDEEMYTRTHEMYNREIIATCSTSHSNRQNEYNPGNNALLRPVPSYNDFLQLPMTPDLLQQVNSTNDDLFNNQAPSFQQTSSYTYHQNLTYLNNKQLPSDFQTASEVRSKSFYIPKTSSTYSPADYNNHFANNPLFPSSSNDSPQPRAPNYVSSTKNYSKLTCSPTVAPGGNMLHQANNDRGIEDGQTKKEWKMQMGGKDLYGRNYSNSIYESHVGESENGGFTSRKFSPVNEASGNSRCSNYPNPAVSSDYVRFSPNRDQAQSAHASVISYPTMPDSSLSCERLPQNVAQTTAMSQVFTKPDFSRGFDQEISHQRHGNQKPFSPQNRDNELLISQPNRSNLTNRLQKIVDEKAIEYQIHVNQQIIKRQELARFQEYLNKVSYDQECTSSQAPMPQERAIKPGSRHDEYTGEPVRHQVYPDVLKDKHQGFADKQAIRSREHLDEPGLRRHENTNEQVREQKYFCGEDVRYQEFGGKGALRNGEYPIEQVSRPQKFSGNQAVKNQEYSDVKAVRHDIQAYRNYEPPNEQFKHRKNADAVKNREYSDVEAVENQKRAVEQVRLQKNNVEEAVRHSEYFEDSICGREKHLDDQMVKDRKTFDKHSVIDCTNFKERIVPDGRDFDAEISVKDYTNFKEGIIRDQRRFDVEIVKDQRQMVQDQKCSPEETVKDQKRFDKGTVGLKKNANEQPAMFQKHSDEPVSEQRMHADKQATRHSDKQTGPYQTRSDDKGFTSKKSSCDGIAKNQGFVEKSYRSRKDVHDRSGKPEEHDKHTDRIQKPVNEEVNGNSTTKDELIFKRPNEIFHFQVPRDVSREFNTRSLESGHGSMSSNWRSQSRFQYFSSSEEDIFKPINRRGVSKSGWGRTRSRSRQRDRCHFKSRSNSNSRVRSSSVDGSAMSRNSSPADSYRAEVYKSYPFSRIKMDHFEMFFNPYDEFKRRDMVHLNRKGLGTIYDLIKRKLSK